MTLESNVIAPTRDIPGIEVSRTEDKWTNIQVDSQVLSAFMACPAKYAYVFIHHLIPLAGMSKSIRKGSIVHDGLLGYWTERISSGDYQIAAKLAIDIVKERLSKEIDFENDEKLYVLQTMIEFFKYIMKSSWIPRAAEKYFRVKAYENEELRLRIFLNGKIDLILESPQIKVLPVDVKTEAERWFHTQMSNQFRIYCIATKTNILGVQRFGFQTSLSEDEKFKMELLPFDQDILDEFRTITVPYWVQQLIIAHEENFFPMNPTNCVHGHFKCQFSDAYNGGICNVSRSVREQKLSRYFVVGKEWDPSLV